jgi:hypothetical protein
MKFLVPNYSCLQNPWLGGHCPQIPVLFVLNWICWTLPRIKFLGTPLVGGEWSFTPWPLYPRHKTPVLTEHETGWVVECDLKFWRRHNSPALVGIRTPDHPACNLVAVPSAVSIYVLVFRIQIYPIYFHSTAFSRCEIQASAAVWVGV